MGADLPRKKRKKKKRKKKRYLLKFTILVLLGIGTYQLLSSEIFDVHHIDVQENVYYTSEQVIEMAGAETGVNLFDASTSKMKKALLKDPYIRSVKIRRIPPGTIRITVDERQEAAAMLIDRQYIIIDQEGLVLRKTDVEPGVPVIGGITIKSAEPGTALEVEENSMFSDTMKLVAVMREYELHFKKIQVSPLLVRAYVNDLMYCEGTPENILQNMDKINSVLYQLYTEGIERGVLKVGGNGYYVFSPDVEESAILVTDDQEPNEEPISGESITEEEGAGGEE